MVSEGAMVAHGLFQIEKLNVAPCNVELRIAKAFAELIRLF